MKHKIQIMMINIIPKIHNLPQVIYIRWLWHEWIIRKL